MKYLFLILCTFSLIGKEPHPTIKVNKWLSDEKELTEGRFFKLASLATVDSSGHPHSRIIEIIQFTQSKGALFFTHENTNKVKDLSYNPHTALNIYLPRTHRQMCIEGVVEPASFEEAEKAWKKMPRYMKVTFMCSKVGETLESQSILETRKKEIEKEYPTEIPCPPYFVGYYLKPKEIIFYESHHRSFPVKEIAILEKEEWISKLVEP
ncbi:MAG: pyridoxamine 5'-phosphate oxidase family protein [Chlamydiia bacterium]|nr:pyridoxamine 5'-phosphate oxidase family protein [Chlamydiia bacterium]